MMTRFQDQAIGIECSVDGVDSQLAVCALVALEELMHEVVLRPNIVRAVRLLAEGEDFDKVATALRKRIEALGGRAVATTAIPTP